MRNWLCALLIAAIIPIAEAAPRNGGSEAGSVQAETPAFSPVWGVLDQLIGGKWGKAPNPSSPFPQTTQTVHEYVWAKDGKAIHLNMRTFGGVYTNFNGSAQYRFKPSTEPGVLEAVFENHTGSRKLTFRIMEDGSLVSEWFIPPHESKLSFMGGGKTLTRRRISLFDGFYAFDSISKPRNDSAERPFSPESTLYVRYQGTDAASLITSAQHLEKSEAAKWQAQIDAYYEKRREERAARSAERWATFGAVMQGAVQVMEQTHPQSASGPRDAYGPVGAAATVGAIQRSPQAMSPAGGRGADPDAASSPKASKPLRFVLTMGMRNLPGDAHNSMCYSNVITRPGPPGWGAPGFLPSGSAEQAQAEINRLKSRFIGLCRASGREITSEGNFSYVWNRSADDEARVQGTGPRYAEDVAVSL